MGVTPALTIREPRGSCLARVLQERRPRASLRPQVALTLAVQRTMDDQTQEYRRHLVLAEQRSVEQYDKALLSLSAGALDVSFAFLDRVVDSGPPLWAGVLFAAWLFWALSLAFVLVSFYLSHKALRRAITEVDRSLSQTGHRPARQLSSMTEWATVVGGVFFLIGVFLMAPFVWKNLGA